MNIQYLRYALEIAETNSLNKAAENLGVQQPNMSRAVKELENQIGISLFIRNAKGMVPTPDGARFLRSAKSVLKDLDDLENGFGKTQTKMQSFSISVPHSIYIADAFSIFTKFIEDDSPAEIFYNETNAAKAISNILEADYRLGIVRYASEFQSYFTKYLEEKNLVSHEIARFRYKVLFSKESFLADLDEIHLSDLKTYVELCHADPYVPTIEMAKDKKTLMPEEIQKRIYVFERASQYDILSINPDVFMFVSPVSREILDKYGLIERDICDTTKEYLDVLIYKSDYKLTNLDNRFITELLEAKKRILG